MSGLCKELSCWIQFISRGAYYKKCCVAPHPQDPTPPPPAPLSPQFLAEAEAAAPKISKAVLASLAAIQANKAKKAAGGRARAALLVVAQAAQQRAMHCRAVTWGGAHGAIETLQQGCGREGSVLPSSGLLGCVQCSLPV